MEKMKRTFEGVWIPKEIWLDENLTWMEKLLFTEIKSFDDADGCWALNGYFAEFFGLSKDRISRMISALKDKGYITVEFTYKKGSKEIEKRIIRVTMTYRIKRQDPIGENTNTLSSKTPKVLIQSINTNIIKDNGDSNESPSPSKKVSKGIEYNEDFLKLWKLYPRPEGKSVAHKHYLKAIKDGVTNKEIQDGIVRYKKHILKNKLERQFIKQGSTFFSQRSWEDEFDVGAETEKTIVVDMNDSL